MKVVILTSSVYGTAAHHLPLIINSKCCKISMVVLNEGIVPKKFKHYKVKIKKILRIGLLGAINGVRMRKWYQHDDQNIKSIEELCLLNNIPFYRTPSINSNTTIDLFKMANADVGLSLGNGYIGKKIFSIPKYGMINIHHEILPDFQNAQSVIWQIYNNSQYTGFTIHKIDSHIDTGDILLKQNIPICFENTLEDTVKKTLFELWNASVNGLISVLSDFDEFNKNATPQGKGKSYTTPSIWQFFRIYLNFKSLKTKIKNKKNEI